MKKLISIAEAIVFSGIIFFFVKIGVEAPEIRIICVVGIPLVLYLWYESSHLELPKVLELKIRLNETENIVEVLNNIFEKTGYTEEYAMRWPDEAASETFLRYLREHGFKS